jgi:hypothetical protein
VFACEEVRLVDHVLSPWTSRKCTHRLPREVLRLGEARSKVEATSLPLLPRLCIGHLIRCRQ